MPLPDVDQDSYNTYTADQFNQQTSRRVQTLQDQHNFLSGVNARVATLGYEPVEVASPTSPLVVGGPGVVLPPIRQPGLPAPPQVPAPPTFQPPETFPPITAPAPPVAPAPVTPPMVAPPIAPPQPPRPPAQPTAPTEPTPPAGGITPVTPLVPGPEPQPVAPGFAEGEPTTRPRAPVFAPTEVNPNPTPDEVRNYISQAAVQRGIDPNIALRVASSEGGFEAARRGTFATGSSWWPFQLHYGGRGTPYENLGTTAGMGNQFTAETGFQPGDPKAWQASVDYALDRAKTSGWGAWYGARDQGITGFQGIGQAPATAAPAAAPAPSAPSPVARPTTYQDISQFGDRELTSDEAYAACGPAAAVRFAQYYGRNPTLREATDLAATVGWTPQQGMAGIASEQRLLEKMGVKTRLVGRDWDAIAAEAQTGNPVTVSTPGHYFFVDGYNPQNNAFHVGRSGLDLLNGSEWMTAQQMEARMGTAQGALFADSPVVPSSSTAAPAPTSLDEVRANATATFVVPSAATTTATTATTTTTRKPAPPAPSQDPQVRQVDQAVQMAYIPPEPAVEPPAVSPARRPFAPPMVAVEPYRPPARQGLSAAGGLFQPPDFDAIGQAISNAISNAVNAASSLGRGGPGGPGGFQRGAPGFEEPEATAYGNRIENPEAPREPFTLGPEGVSARAPYGVGPEPPLEALPRRTGPIDERAQREIERFRRVGGNLALPELPLPELGMTEFNPPRDPLEAIQRGAAEALRRGVPSPGPTGRFGILDPKLADPFANPEDILGAGLGPTRRTAEEALERGFETGRVAAAARQAARRATTPGETLVSRAGVPTEVLPGPTIVGRTGEPRPGFSATIAGLGNEYADQVGLPRAEPRSYVLNDVPKQTAIADYYERAVSNPNDPEVQQAYRAFADESHRQFEFLRSKGYEFEPYGPGTAHPDNPYPNSAAMRRDLEQNKHLWVYTGTDEPHPLLTEQQNWEFRAVHDFFGHARSANQFGARGEENAWLEHLPMFSPEAQKAMTTETRGQNSWVNFGPNAAQNRADPTRTVFAAQKAIVLPEELRSPSRAAPGEAFAAPHGMAVPRPGYAPNTPEQFVEDLLRQRAQEQGTATPHLSGEDIRSMPGMSGARLDDLDEVRDAVQEGMAAARWYTDMVARIRADTGETINPREAAVLMGRFGGNAGVQANYHAMLSVFDAMRQVMPDLTGFEKMDVNAIKATQAFKDVEALVRKDKAYAKSDDLAKVMRAYRTGIVEIPSGAKLSSYTQNFLHALNDLYDPYSTQDVWQGRLFGSRVSKAGTGTLLPGAPDVNQDATYRSMHALTNWISRELNINPREAQAAGWAVMRTLWEDPQIGPGLQTGQTTLRQALQSRRAGTLLGNALADTTGEVMGRAKVPSEWDNKIADLRARIANNGSFDRPPDPSWTASGNMALQYPGRGTGTVAATVQRPAGPAEVTALRGMAVSDSPIIQVPGRVQVDPETGRIPWLRSEHSVQQVGPNTYVTVVGVGDEAAELIGQRLGAQRYSHASPEVPNVGGFSIDGLTPEEQVDVVRGLRARGLPVISSEDTSGLRVPLIGGDLEGNATIIRRVLADIGSQVDPIAYQGVTHELGPGAGRAAPATRYPARAPGPLGVPPGYGVYDRGLAERLFRDAGELPGAAARPGAAAAARAVPVGAAAAAAGAAEPTEPGAAPGEPAQPTIGLQAGVRSALTDPETGPAVEGLLRGESGAASPVFAVRAGGAAAGALAASVATDPDDPNRAAKIAAGALAGFEGARLFSNWAMRGSASAGRALSRNAPQQGLDAFVRATSDELVDMNHIAEEFERRIGRPMKDEERLAYLARVDPTHRSLIATENAFGQSIRRIKPSNLEDFYELVKLKSNISTAEGLGTKVGEEFLRGGPDPVVYQQVRRAQADVDAAQKLVDDMVAAQKPGGARMGVYGGVPTNRQVGFARTSLNAAKKRLADAQADVTQATADMPAAAAAQAQAQREGRVFEGGAQYQDLQRQLQDLRDKYKNNPAELARMEKAAQDVFNFSKVLREELVDAGVITREEANELARLYPDWTPTNYTDYLTDDTARGVRAGDRASVTSDGFRSYTLDGYEGEQQNKIASQLRYSDSVYALGAKNRTFLAFTNAISEIEGPAFKKIANTWAEFETSGGTKTNRMYAPDYRPKVGQGEQTVTGFRDGTKEVWVTNNPYVKAAIEMSPDSALGGAIGKAIRAGTTVTRATATGRNPWWIAFNMLADTASYMVGTMAEGGVAGNAIPLAMSYGPAMYTYMTTDPNDPQRLQKALAAGVAGYAARSAIGALPGTRRVLGPNIAGELVRGYADAFRGFSVGRLQGAGTQEILMQGAGMRGGTYYRGAVSGAEKRLQDIVGSGGIQIRSKDDLGRLTKSMATFNWVQEFAKRTELGPRVAAYNVARARGETPLQAMVRAREVTLDFDMGGTLTKQVNQVIPFFNAQVQGGARFLRLAKDDPYSLALAGLTLIGGPSLAMMEWNRADPQRSKDFDDVPDYIKKRGPVLMTGIVLTDKDGNPKPLHIDFDVRQFAPFWIAAQEGYDRAQGRPGRAPGELAGALAEGQLPGVFSSPANLALSAIPPPLSTAVQLQQNRDVFRDTTIANRFSDEAASQLGKDLAPIVENALTRVPGFETARIHPSQIDFLVKDIANGLGQIGLNVYGEAAPYAKAALTGQPVQRPEPRIPGAPTEIPVIGGAAGRLVRSTGGAEFERVREPTQMMAQDVRQRFRSLGDYYEPSVVPDEIQKVPLRQAEQAEFQRLTNQYFNQYIRAYMDSSAFEIKAARDQLRDRAMTSARKVAAAEVLAQIRSGGSNLAERYLQKSSAP